MLALLDGDIVAYRTSAAYENASEQQAKWQCDQTITRIIEDTNADDWKVFLSGDNNFRYGLYPAYKANRKDMVKPKWLEHLREHLVTEWDAVICDGIEADDALGIALCQAQADGCDAVCASIDKDLRQLPGNNFNFVNRQWLYISDLDGARNFYTQLLVGDATDNIKGCPGIGPVKAERALRPCTSTQELYDRCVQLYWEALGNNFWETLELNAQLLYVHRKENDCWNPPPRKQEQEVAPKL